MLGFLSFTEVTDPAFHADYNRWHQLDHLPQQFTLDGVLFGQRWVRTPACRGLEVASGSLLEACQYVTLYLLRDASVVPIFMGLAASLRSEGRFFEARRAHLAGPFFVTGRVAAPRAQVTADVVPHRPSNGVYVVVRSAGGGGPVGLGETLLGQDSGGDEGDVAGVWDFEGPLEVEVQYQVALAFIDGDVRRAAADLGRTCLAAVPDPADLIWAGPLERIDVNRWNWFDRLTPQCPAPASPRPNGEPNRSSARPSAEPPSFGPSGCELAIRYRGTGGPRRGGRGHRSRGHRRRWRHPAHAEEPARAHPGHPGVAAPGGRPADQARLRRARPSPSARSWPRWPTPPRDRPSTACSARPTSRR